MMGPLVHQNLIKICVSFHRGGKYRIDFNGVITFSYALFYNVISSRSKYL